MAGVRNGIRRIAEINGEWAGIPMPMDGSPLIIEPSYPRAEALMAISRKPEDDPAERTTLRNKFWSWRWRTDVLVWEEGGKIVWGPSSPTNRLGLELSTLGASDAWGIEQESIAIHMLATLLPHRQFKQYMLTGIFMEKSPRSNVHYIFRKLRPTIAVSMQTGQCRVLCALCLHPIAYYEGSWAGAMCPTDDVIAHLMLMRGDEPMFWRRANQHAAYRREAGI